MNTIVKNLLTTVNEIAEKNTVSPVFPDLDKAKFKAIFADGSHYSILNDNGDRVYFDDPDTRYIIRDDYKTKLGNMGNKYCIGDNLEIKNALCEGLEKAFKKQGNLHALQNPQLIENVSDGGSLCRFGYHFDGLGREIRQLTKSKTQLNFRALAVNSFNGQSAVRIQTGGLCLDCLNGNTSGELHAQSWGHTASFDPSLIIPFIEKQVEYYELQVQTWQKWALNEITHEQAFNVLSLNYPASESEIKRAEKKGISAGEVQSRKTAQLMEQFDLECQARGRTTWSLYSALTFYSSHSEGNFTVKNSLNKDNIERTLIEREKEVNKVIASPAFLEIA